MVHLGGPADYGEFGRRTLMAGTQTLLRGLSILELVGNGVSSVKGLTDRLQVPRSTITRMIHNLVTEGYLYHVPERGYFLGARLVELGNRAREQRPLAGIARPFLEALSEQVLDTIHLAVPTNDGAIIYLDKINGSRGFQMRSRVGLTMPMAFTGLGKAILMTMDESEWKDFYDFTSSQRHLKDGWPELKSYPEFFSDENNAVASISISSTLNFMPRQRINLLGPVIVRCAQRFLVNSVGVMKNEPLDRT